ncbi:Phosphoinositide phospholipase C 2 [Forsythia ovata]|uniref:Phosphoinositide phospholipase C n=1 Tax=Forsythia ovata TaxID=205694 RepID=A0ABD1SJG0_9LAMI
MSKQTYRVCFCFSRGFRQKEAETPAEIKALFEKYSENGVMTAENLHKFLQEVQGEESENVMESFLNLHKHLNIFHRKSLYLEEFFQYLLSDLNAPLPSPPKVHQDMTGPLSHYFIFTGHNSYLTGNQISSDCSDLPIIEALQRGVRVIELDMWPNSTKDDVHILHGGTLTTPVTLIKCLKSIRDNAFVASEYPLIITLEDHLTPDLQAKVAEMVTQTFGDVLVSTTTECLSQFPSPESLKRRVILSTKPPKEYLETESGKEEDNGISKVKKSPEEAAWGMEVSDFLDKSKINIENDLEHGEYQDEEDQQDENHSLQQNAAPEYKKLIAIRAEKMKGGIKAWVRVDSQKAHRVSLNEEKLENAVKTHGTDIVRFTQRNLMRVYPKASRIDSSNFNPLNGWMHGAQMVAFNMQGHGRSLWLMQGMFRANGGCGYVKKPEFLLKVGPNDEVFDPKMHLPVKKILKVKVYMGEGWNLDFKHTHFDLYSPPDFYAKVGIAGVTADTVIKQTKTIEDNWFPAWNEEFEFPLTVPELALLRVEVHEFDMQGKDDFGGQTCIPVSELKTGIRAVPLHNRKGDKYKSVKLLMRFDFV